jgi:hypothetical protein
MQQESAIKFPAPVRVLRDMVSSGKEMEWGSFIFSHHITMLGTDVRFSKECSESSAIVVFRELWLRIQHNCCNGCNGCRGAVLSRDLKMDGP